MSPKSMLHKLGIRPLRKVSTKHESGAEPENDPMGATASDLLFADEKTALQTLGGNFDRIVNSMERVAGSAAFKQGKVQRVVELGGGTGLVGMWLVLTGLCETCEVFDHAANPLELGKRWATSLGIKGVTFRQRSYAALAGDEQPSADFVFAEHAASFDYWQPRMATTEELLNPENCPMLPLYNNLTGAFKALLKPCGIGLIGSGVITPVCVAALCRSLRNQALSIEWRFTSIERGLQLFVIPSSVTLFETFEEDALAILNGGGDLIPSSGQHMLSLEKLFRRGRKYLEVCSEDHQMSYKCEMFEEAGLVGLFQATSDGGKKAKYFGAGRMPELAKAILKEAEGRHIVKKDIDNKLGLILS